jgi:hypothetical protein
MGLAPDRREDDRPPSGHFWTRRACDLLMAQRLASKAARRLPTAVRGWPSGPLFRDMVASMRNGVLAVLRRRCRQTEAYRIFGCGA